MNFNLSHVNVPAILMITDDCYQNHECSNGPIIDVFNRNYHSSVWII